MQLTQNFTLKELERSATAERLGIINEANVEQLLNLQHLCDMVLQPLRDRFGAITISSGLRTSALNKAVGGAKNSQHMTGEAADIRLPSVAKGREYYEYLKTLPRFDQLIWETQNGTAWIHVSVSRLGRNRKQVFSISK